MTTKNKIALLGTVIEEFVQNDSDDENDIPILSILLPNGKKKRNCPKNFDLVIFKYSTTEFKGHFRLEKSTVNLLLEKIGSEIYQPSLKGGRSSCPEKQLLVTLWFLANQEVYRSVADRFDLPISTAWEYVQKVVFTLVKHVKEYIYWPTDINATAQEFQKRAGIKGVVGAIDGTHVQITAPSYMANSYLNRKKYHSIILQAVCDANYVFTDCFAGCPGSIHDARVFKMSPLYRCIDNLIDSDHHLLGDSAYPNSLKLVTPYRDDGYLPQKKKKLIIIIHLQECASSNHLDY